MAKTGATSLPVVTTSDLDRAARAARAAGNPYARVRFDRHDRTRKHQESLRRTQWAVLGLVVVVAGLLVALAHASREAKVIPYVVEVDRHGTAVAAGPATRVPEVDRRLIVHHLVLWITRARTVTRDAALQRREILEAYELTGGRAVGLLNDWYRETKPFGRAETETVTVTVEDVESLLAVDSSLDRWRLQWTETHRSPAGGTVRTELWQALLTVEVDPAERLDEVEANPLGVFVTDFDWTRISDSSEP